MSEAADRERIARAVGAEVTRCERLPGQLGLRRFYRVWLAEGTPRRLVARIDAPEDPRGRPHGIPPEPPLEPIRALLEAQGLPVPARLGGDAEGLDLLEDVGDAALADVAASSGEAEREALYAEACALVPRLQRVRDPGDVEAFRRRLDDAYLAYKADLVARWGLGARGRPADAAERAALREGFAAIADAVREAPARLAHRDLQGRNLHLRPERPPGERLVMIDLQGAFLAPPEYDLVCLLRDSYVELPEALVQALCLRVRPELPDAPDAETFAHRFDLLAVARKGKDHARFLQAAAERGDRRYLRYAPRTASVVRAAAARAAARDPRLRPLAELLAGIPETPCAR